MDQNSIQSTRIRDEKSQSDAGYQKNSLGYIGFFMGVLIVVLFLLFLYSGMMGMPLLVFPSIILLTILGIIGTPVCIVAIIRSKARGGRAVSIIGLILNLLPIILIFWLLQPL